MFYIFFFLNIQINVETNAMILLNMTKPPVGKANVCFNERVIYSFIQPIHSETSQSAVVMNGPLDH